MFPVREPLAGRPPAGTLKRAAAALPDVFDARRYEVRQKLRLRDSYAIYEGDGDDPILTSKQKRFRLKEDFRFVDADTGEEAFRVRAGSVLDLASTYDVVDSRTGERIGAVKRSPLSMFRQQYALLGPDGGTVGTIREDGVLRAALRRYVTTLVPFAYEIEGPTGRLGTVREALSLRDRYAIELTGEIDPRLAVIGTVVIDAIEEN